MIRGFALDREQLERAYLERASAAHPDRVVGASSEIRRAAMEDSAAINVAYRVLRDPVARAEYLVALAGIDLDSNDRQTGAPHPEQAFLIEMIERRDQLDELDQADESARGRLREGVEAEIDEVFDAALAALAAGETPRAALALVHRRYLQRFLDEIDART
ncbi:Fe-S protein assembly co-chaperone HscB [Nannocystaceae bacterium ST9]